MIDYGKLDKMKIKSTKRLHGTPKITIKGKCCTSMLYQSRWQTSHKKDKRIIISLHQEYYSRGVGGGTPIDGSRLGG